MMHGQRQIKYNFLFRRFSQNSEKRILASSCLYVCPHGKTPLLLNGFSWNLIFEDFSKICREISSIIKTGQEKHVLYGNTNIHFRSHLAHFFLEWNIFQTKVVEEIKIHILYPITFFPPRIVPFMR